MTSVRLDLADRHDDIRGVMDRNAMKTTQAAQ
jgi:hypothetical protein